MSDESKNDDVKGGWQAILQRAEHWKAGHLSSGEFIDLDEAAERLGKLTAELEGHLLVLSSSPAHIEQRVPVWALSLFGAVTEALFSIEPEPWALYVFLTSREGMLNGERPLDLLPSRLAEVLVCLDAVSPLKAREQRTIEIVGVEDAPYANPSCLRKTQTRIPSFAANASETAPSPKDEL